jgi:hypothetical protein
MSEMGQTRKSALVTIMSAFPPIATKLRTSLKVRVVPKGDIALENEGGRPTGAHHEFLSPLQFHPAHEITFSERRALVAGNVVSRGRMEKEVRQRERHQEAFCCEQKRVFARFAPESKDYAARPTSPFRAKLGSFPAYTARPFYLSRGDMV